MYTITLLHVLPSNWKEHACRDNKEEHPKQLHKSGKNAANLTIQKDVLLHISLHSKCFLKHLHSPILKDNLVKWSFVQGHDICVRRFSLRGFKWRTKTSAGLKFGVSKWWIQTCFLACLRGTFCWKKKKDHNHKKSVPTQIPLIEGMTALYPSCQVAVSTLQDKLMHDLQTWVFNLTYSSLGNLFV